MKKILFFIFSLIISLGIFSLASCGNKKTNIVSTSYAGYDLAKSVAGDLKTSSMLLKPGEELHDYSPSVGDIEKIINSEIFIYIGGESDEVWVEKQILPEINKEKTKVINMVELVKNSGKVYDEELPESGVAEEAEEGEEEHELDEHVWNSITNAKLIVNEISKLLCEIDSNNQKTYKDNCNNTISKLDEIDNKIKNVISEGNKNLLIFADRFPLLYFVKEYNLTYDAAFKGCETAKEANPRTIEKLTKKIIDNNIKVLFVIELSESNIASTIITNCKNEGHDVTKRVFYTMHNVSKDDYNNGITYIDFMNKNIESLKEALK